MWALIFEYIPVDILIGLGIGLLGGIISAIFIPIRFNQRPSTVMDIFAFSLFFLALLVALLFPVTMYLASIFTFFVIWITIPFLFGVKKRKKREVIIAEEVEETVALVSPEGRAAVLDQMGILPL